MIIYQCKEKEVLQEVVKCVEVGLKQKDEDDDEEDSEPKDAVVCVNILDAEELHLATQYQQVLKWSCGEK
jgi:hypothetical protein